MNETTLVHSLQWVLGFGFSTMAILIGAAFRVGKAANKIESAADMIIDHERRITQLEHVHVKYASLYPQMRKVINGENK